MMKREQLIAKVRSLGHWYHNVYLGDGVWTNPNHPEGNYPQKRWDALEPFVPANLEGMSVLDIGCGGGFFSVKMKQRGAGYVLGIDVTPWSVEQGKFLAEHFGLDIDFRVASAYEIDTLGRPFDIVVFLGVFYHLRYPLYALDKIAKVCRDILLFQSVIRGPSGPIEMKEDFAMGEDGIFDHPNYPKMYFIEKRYNNDETNWWFPNRNAVVAMLRSAGFRSAHLTRSPDTLICYRSRTPEGAIPFESLERAW